MTCEGELGVLSPPLLADSFSLDSFTPDTVWGPRVQKVQNIQNGSHYRVSMEIASQTADAEKRCCH